MVVLRVCIGVNHRSAAGTRLHRRKRHGVAETAFYNHPPAGRATIAVRRGPARSYDQEQIVTEARDGFVAELEGFAQLIRDGAAAWPGVTPAESIDTAAMLEALHASARTGAPVDLPPA